jgi:hypothetical protein
MYNKLSMSSKSYTPDIKIGIDDRPMVSLGPEVSAALTSLAIRNSFTVDEAIARAVVNEDFLERLVDDDGQLILKRGRNMNFLELS